VFAGFLGLSGTQRSKQTDFERSFFGNGQGETIEFGADQCMEFRQRYSILYQLFLPRYTCA